MSKNICEKNYGNYMLVMGGEIIFLIVIGVTVVVNITYNYFKYNRFMLG